MSPDSIDPDHELDSDGVEVEIAEAAELEAEQFDVDHTVDPDGDEVRHDRDGARLADSDDWDGPTSDDEFHRMTAWLNKRAGKFR